MSKIVIEVRNGFAETKREKVLSDNSSYIVRLDANALHEEQSTKRTLIGVQNKHSRALEELLRGESLVIVYLCPKQTVPSRPVQLTQIVAIAQIDFFMEFELESR